MDGGVIINDNGTPIYMAPEQWRGEICLKTDIWAFGCVLFEICTGKKPYFGNYNNM